MNTAKNLTSYDLQAQAFLERTRTRMKVRFVSHGRYFNEHEDERDIFCVYFTRDRGDHNASIAIRFGQSINKSTGDGGEPPSAYDVLACLTKSEPGTFEEFCAEYGYDNDSIAALTTYKAVVKEWQKVRRIWGDCLEELQEIN